MTAYISEIIGTALLIILGNGVVANVVLNKTKGHGSGWIVITFGWAMAVFTGVFVAAAGSGAHLNPAVTIAMAYLGKIELNLVPGYVLSQFIGAMTGQVIVWLAYRGHYDETLDAGAIRATFCTSPAINSTWNNLITEIIGTVVLVSGVLFMAAPAASLGAMDALPVALLVLGIGLSLGGPTGYAINPARDLGPRIVHAFLPIRHKGDNEWSYSWIPVVGPIIGALAAALLYSLIS
ncbi:MAG: aquaporin family protein [Saprospiraceae bacterium]|jgi:glycerol uptake facilitator protein|nr:aquaporin family protein [Saprospiraceae bacterium]